MLTRDDFEKVEMRVWTIIEVHDFPEAKNPAFQLRIDFWDIGIKKSSAQITKLYSKDVLLWKQIIAVTNFPPKQIATFMSECLVLGVIGENKEITLLTTDKKTNNGYRIG